MGITYLHKGDDVWKSAVAGEKTNYVAISVEEYNGLSNMLRILHDRAIQQIDKSQADQYGYKLLKAILEGYKGYWDKQVIWKVYAQTPYSSNMQLEHVKIQVERDMNCYYNGVLGQKIDIDDLVFRVDHARKEIKRIGAIQGCQEYDSILAEHKINKLKYVIDIVQFSVNYSQGIYEIAYRVTDL